jgi:hypothetical protein
MINRVNIFLKLYNFDAAKIKHMFFSINLKLEMK